MIDGGVRVTPFGSEHLEGFRALFDAIGSGCFCRYWHYDGNKNGWLDRMAHRPEENLAEARTAVEAGGADAQGLVALEPGGRLVGWVKITRRDALPKLRGLAVYRHVLVADGPDEATFGIGCFVVHPEARRQGVATALLTGAETHAARWGATALEGYPRRSSAPLYDEEAWQGPEKLFVDRGFTAVVDDPPYPVYRKVLAR